MRLVQKHSIMRKQSEIWEGNNIMRVKVFGDDEDGSDYIDKKYNEGWEIVTHDSPIYTLHKKHRSAKETNWKTRARPRI